MRTSLIARGLYRIPALVWDQGLLTLFDARLSVDDLPAPIDVVSARSSDGITWTTQNQQSSKLNTAVWAMSALSRAICASTDCPTSQDFLRIPPTLNPGWRAGM